MPCWSRRWPALNCSSDQTTLPPHSRGAYQFHRWLSVATRNNPRPPLLCPAGPVAIVRFAGPDRYWDGCHDFGKLSAREANRTQPPRIGPRRDELGTFATLISRFVHLPPGYQEALRALGEGPVVTSCANWKAAARWNASPPWTSSRGSDTCGPRKSTSTAVAAAGPRARPRRCRESVRVDHSPISQAAASSSRVNAGALVAGARVTLNTARCYAASDLAPQPPQLGLQRIQLGTGNGDHVGRCDVHIRLPRLDASPASLVDGADQFLRPPYPDPLRLLVSSGVIDEDEAPSVGPCPRRAVPVGTAAPVGGPQA